MPMKGNTLKTSFQDLDLEFLVAIIIPVGIEYLEGNLSESIDISDKSCCIHAYVHHVML